MIPRLCFLIDELVGFGRFYQKEQIHERTESTRKPADGAPDAMHHGALGGRGGVCDGEVFLGRSFGRWSQIQRRIGPRDECTCSVGLSTLKSVVRFGNLQ